MTSSTLPTPGAHSFSRAPRHSRSRRPVSTAASRRPTSYSLSAMEACSWGLGAASTNCWTPGTSTGFRGSTRCRPRTSCPSPPVSWGAPGTRPACSRPWRGAYRSQPRLAGAQVVDVIRRANGAAAAVDEDEISTMQRALARDEGIFAEPTSAAAFAGVRRLIEDGVISPSESVLVPVTGFGLKDEVRFDPDR